MAVTAAATAAVHMVSAACIAAWRLCPVSTGIIGCTCDAFRHTQHSLRIPAQDETIRQALLLHGNFLLTRHALHKTSGIEVLQSCKGKVLRRHDAVQLQGLLAMVDACVGLIEQHRLSVVIHSTGRQGSKLRCNTQGQCKGHVMLCQAVSSLRMVKNWVSPQMPVGWP